MNWIGRKTELVCLSNRVVIQQRPLDIPKPGRDPLHLMAEDLHERIEKARKEADFQAMLCQILRELRLALTDIRQRCGLASWSTALAADQELEWMKANPDVFSTNQLGNEHLPTTSEESDNSIVEKYTALAF